ncbi:MAG: histidinol-phosphate transaminase [Coriobacteriales bacterium]|nr:histidinol-phosphate transaminase [Coriobacteriales bacterium]
MLWEHLIRKELEPMVPYSPGLRASEVRERSGHDTIVKLSSNECPYGPTPTALSAMEAVLPRLNRYPDGAARALRRRLCERTGVAEPNLVIGNGSNELLRLIAQATLRPGDEVVFSWPSFIVYPMVTQMFGATAVRVPLADGEVHDLDAMRAAITDRTRIVFLCNPNNPTGTIYGADGFKRFMAEVPEHVLVVVDEAYYEYVDDPSYPRTLDYFDGERPLVVLRTFSKIYGLAGLRIGYGAFPEPLAGAIHKVREPFNINAPAQVAAYYSLADDAEVERRKVENQEQKTYLYSAFDRLRLRYVPSQTNFVYVLTDKPVEVFEALLERGVIVRDFGTAPALRVGVGTPEETHIAVTAFEAAVAKLGSL